MTDEIRDRCCRGAGTAVMFLLGLLLMIFLGSRAVIAHNVQRQKGPMGP